MNKINVKNWRRYNISDLFEIKRPASRVRIQYVKGNVPFVATSNYNNGVTDYYKPKESEILEKGNCITVSPLNGSAFYQAKDFLGRGGAGSAIILLYNDNLNELNGLFISTIIRNKLTKYSYVDQLSSKSILKEHIYLPSKNDEPDWDYMSNFMSNISQQAKSKFNDLNQRIKYIK